MLGIILGGGAGSRLYPLTKTRAKPAVPLGANYRLIDIPVSNCINSGVNKIYCLTQFNSASLNRHLSSAYVSLVLKQVRWFINSAAVIWTAVRHRVSSCALPVCSIFMPTLLLKYTLLRLVKGIDAAPQHPC